MGAYEGLRSERTTSPIASVPTERMRRGDFSEITTQIVNPITKVPYPGNQIPPSQLSDEAVRLLQYYPLPNLPGTANGTGNNYQAPALTESNIDQLLLRVDQNISNAARLYVRYNWVDAFDGFGNVVPTTGLFQPRVNKNTLVSWQQTLSPTLLNDFRIGYHRLDIDSLNNLMIAGVPSAGSDIGIPGFDGDVTLRQPGHPDDRPHRVLGHRQRRHQLVPVRHDVPDVQRAVLDQGHAQHPDRVRRAQDGDRPPRRQRPARGVQFQRLDDRLRGRRLHDRRPDHDHHAGRPGAGPRRAVAQRLLRQRRVAGHAQHDAEPGAALRAQHAGADLRRLCVDAQRRPDGDHPVVVPGGGLRVPRAEQRRTGGRVSARPIACRTRPCCAPGGASTTTPTR